MNEIELLRFADKVHTGTDDDCWEWIGAKCLKGYGRFKVSGRLYGAHRLAYVIAYGEFEPGEGTHGAVVMHECDNPSCCNPLHLKLGDMSQNMKGCLARGRLFRPENRRSKNRSTSAQRPTPDIVSI